MNKIAVLLTASTIIFASSCDRKCDEDSQCGDGQRCVDTVCADVDRGANCTSVTDRCAVGQVCFFSRTLSEGVCQDGDAENCGDGFRQESQSCVGPKLCPAGEVFVCSVPLANATANGIGPSAQCDGEVVDDDEIDNCTPITEIRCEEDDDCGGQRCRIRTVDDAGKVVPGQCVAECEDDDRREGSLCIAKGQCVPGERHTMDPNNLPDGVTEADCAVVGAACAPGYEDEGGVGPCLDLDECAGLDCGTGRTCNNVAGRVRPPTAEAAALCAVNEGVLLRNVGFNAAPVTNGQIVLRRAGFTQQKVCTATMCVRGGLSPVAAP